MRWLLPVVLVTLNIITQLSAQRPQTSSARLLMNQKQEETLDRPLVRAQSVLASELDSSLPAIPIGEWLTNVVQADRDLQWTQTGCPASQEFIKVKAVNRPVCALATATRLGRPGPRAAKGAVMVAVSIRLGNGNPNGSPWQLERPQVEDAFIERDNDSLSVPQLRDLPVLLNLPPAKWPKVDLSVSSDDIRCDKVNPILGEHVKCGATIYNRGPLEAIVRLTTGLTEVGNDIGSGKELFDKIPSNGRVVVAWDRVWPQGREWYLQVRVELITPHAYGGYRIPMKEPNVRNNSAHVKIATTK